MDARRLLRRGAADPPASPEDPGASEKSRPETFRSFPSSTNLRRSPRPPPNAPPGPGPGPGPAPPADESGAPRVPRRTIRRRPGPSPGALRRGRRRRQTAAAGEGVMKSPPSAPASVSPAFSDSPAPPRGPASATRNPPGVSSERSRRVGIVVGARRPAAGVTRGVAPTPAAALAGARENDASCAADGGGKIPSPARASTIPPISASGGYRSEVAAAAIIASLASSPAPRPHSSSCAHHRNGSRDNASEKRDTAARRRPVSLQMSPSRWNPAAPAGTRSSVGSRETDPPPGFVAAVFEGVPSSARSASGSLRSL